MPKDQVTADAQMELLDALIRERLGAHARYTFFFTAGQGRYLPGTRIEEYSGYVLDASGRAYFFWLGWDAAASRPALVRWREELPSPHWETSDEYQRARARLGLS